MLRSTSYPSRLDQDPHHGGGHLQVSSIHYSLKVRSYIKLNNLINKNNIYREVSYKSIAQDSLQSSRMLIKQYKIHLLSLLENS